MARPLIFALVLLLGLVTRAFAAEPEEMRTKTYIVSPYFLGGSDNATFAKTPKGLIDLRGYLKMREIEIPRDGEATYDPKAHRIVVRAPEEVLDRIGEDWSGYGAGSVRAVFTLVEFSATDALEFPDLGYEQLRKLAGESWRVNDRVTLVCKTGNKVMTDLLGKKAPPGKAGKPVKEKKTDGDIFDVPISENQYGTRVEIEPLISSDGVTVELAFAYLHRSRALGEQSPVLMRCQMYATLTHNEPVIVQTGTMAPPKDGNARGPAKEWALIVQASMLDRYGRSITLDPPATAEAQPPVKR